MMTFCLSRLLSDRAGDNQRFGAASDLMSCDELGWLQSAVAKDPEERLRAALSLATLPERHSSLALRLLHDDSAAVREAALTALGYQEPVSLWQDLVGAVGYTATRCRAVSLLAARGPSVVPVVGHVLDRVDDSTCLRLIRVLERIGSAEAMALLADALLTRPSADEAVRTALLQALTMHHYRASPAQILTVELQLSADRKQADGLQAVLIDLGRARSPVCPVLVFLGQIVEVQLSRCHWRIAAFQVLLDRTDAPYTPYPRLRLNATERLLQLLEPAQLRQDRWLWICAAHTAVQMGLTGPRVDAALDHGRRYAPQDRLLQEAARTSRNDGDQTMLSTLERVMFLKGVNLFHEIPDATLIDLAVLLEDVQLAAGVTLFEQGAVADAMYIIVEGRVVVHDGVHEINVQQRGEAFGELGLLDAQPRLAKVAALEDTWLMKLDQEGFYLLLEDHIEFTRGVIRTLSGYVRGNLRHVSDLEFRISGGLC